MNIKVFNPKLVTISSQSLTQLLIYNNTIGKLQERIKTATDMINNAKASVLREFNHWLRQTQLDTFTAMKKRLSINFDNKNNDICPTITYYYYPHDVINIAVDDVTDNIISNTVDTMVDDSINEYIKSEEEELGNNEESEDIYVDLRNLNDAQKILLKRHELPSSLSLILEWMNNLRDKLSNDKCSMTTTNVTFINCIKNSTKISKVPKLFTKAKKGSGNFSTKDYPRYSNFTGILETGAGVTSGFRDIRSWRRNNFIRPNYDPNPDNNPYRLQESSLVLNIQGHLLIVSEPLYGPYDITRTKIYDPSSLSSWTLIVGSQRILPSFWTNASNCINTEDDYTEITNEKKSLELATAERIVWMTTLTGTILAAKSLIIKELEHENETMESQVAEGITIIFIFFYF